MAKTMREINRKEPGYYSIPQVAALLGISRIAVFKQVKRGDIKARKIGRGYAIPSSYIQQLSGKTLTPQRKMAIKKAVRKTVKQYGPLLIRLGKE
jgi:excisionase family DNA binding protein